MFSFFAASAVDAFASGDRPITRMADITMENAFCDRERTPARARRVRAFTLICSAVSRFMLSFLFIPFKPP